MNDVTLDKSSVSISIVQRNLEIIHIIENEIPDIFAENALISGIFCWNDEICQYALDNYNFNLFNEEEEEYNDDAENDKYLMEIIAKTFTYYNLSFLKSFLLGFLRKNRHYTEKYIYRIINQSFFDFSCFVPKEFLKYPGIDINSYSPLTNNNTFLINAINIHNIKAIETLLNYPDIDVNLPGGKDMLPIQVACNVFLEMKAIQMICNHPKFDFNIKDHDLNFFVAVFKGNTYSAEYFINHYQIDETKFLSLFTFCLEKDYLLMLKILLKQYLKKPSNKISLQTLIKRFESMGIIKYVNTIKNLLETI